MNMKFEIEAGEVYLIDLPQELEGFRNFISSWIALTENGNFLVDVGPASTIPKLIEVLEKLGVDVIDYILLTHIHIDHAGGIGHLIERFPKARVLAHPKSHRYLTDPRDLWLGSKRALGGIAIKYGEIRSVPMENLIYREKIEFGHETIASVQTPGHAAHHLAFKYRDILFAGEAGGVYQDIGEIYMRPATPSKFFFEIAINSIDRLMELDIKKICYAHYGFAINAKEMLNMHRDQLFLWKNVSEGVLNEFKDCSEEEVVLREIFERLLKADVLFSRYSKLDEDIQKREKYFVLNSIRGYLEYLKGIGIGGDQPSRGLKA